MRYVAGGVNTKRQPKYAQNCTIEIGRRPRANKDLDYQRPQPYKQPLEHDIDIELPNFSRSVEHRSALTELCQRQQIQPSCVAVTSAQSIYCNYCFMCTYICNDREAGPCEHLVTPIVPKHR